MHLAGGEQPLGHLPREMPRHQRSVAVEQKVIGLGPVAASDNVNIAGAARNDQPGLGALALDQGIDRCGRAVDQFADVGGCNPALADAVDHALHQMRRRGQAFGVDETAGPRVEADQIGEGSANVHRNDDHAHDSILVASNFGRWSCR
jgi:hypothetical protein